MEDMSQKVLYHVFRGLALVLPALVQIDNYRAAVFLQLPTDGSRLKTCPRLPVIERQ